MLFSPLNKLEFQIDGILRRVLDKQLYSPKRDDVVRLFKLTIWAERYSVSLEYILGRLVPHYEKLAQRHYVRRNAGASKGLGVSVAVLTGPAAEEKLREFIVRDFPDDEHIASAREEAKETCLGIMDKHQLTGRPRSILRYETVSDFIEAYAGGIDRNRKSTSRLEKKMSKQPWRGNPWR